MHDNVSSGSTTYLVAVRREQVADVLVDLPGQPSPEGRAEAARIAAQRMDAREAVAWATVGKPVIVAAGPVSTDAVACDGEMLDAKIASREIATAPAAKTAEPVVDLMAALRASIEAARAARPSGPAPGAQPDAVA